MAHLSSDNPATHQKNEKQPICSFKEADQKRVIQPVYGCRTCELVAGLGICYACAMTCHENHDTYYNFYGAFLCDCGVRGSPFCHTYGESSNARIKPTVLIQDPNVKKTLECLVCFTYMCAPIHMCEQGHSMCNSCKTKIKRCPQCWGEFPGVRNLLMEELGKAMEITCDYCGMNVLLSEINAHKKVCSMKTYKCPLGSDCTWLGKLSEISEHSMDMHPTDVLKGACHSFDHADFSASRRKEYASQIVTDDGLFTFHRGHDRKADMFQAVVKCVCQNDGDVWTYEIKFFAPNRKESVVFTKTVRPDSETIQDIYKLRNCVCLSMHQAVSFVGFNLLHYKLTLWKC